MVAHGFVTPPMKSKHDATLEVRTGDPMRSAALAVPMLPSRRGRKPRAVRPLCPHLLACRFATPQRQSGQMHALLALWLVLAGGSETAPASIRGIVVDPVGVPLAGGTLALGIPRAIAVTTGADGRFEIAVATPGRRRLTITLPGFQSSESTTIVASPDAVSAAPKELRITLLPRALGETVNVTATRGGERLEGAAPVSV